MGVEWQQTIPSLTSTIGETSVLAERYEFADLRSQFSVYLLSLLRLHFFKKSEEQEEYCQPWLIEG